MKPAIITEFEIKETQIDAGAFFDAEGLFKSESLFDASALFKAEALFNDGALLKFKNIGPAF